MTFDDDGEHATTTVAGSPSSRRGLPVWQESILLLGFALVLAVVVKSLFVQAFYIPSESMEPGLVKNDRILVEKPSYWGGGTPERGDVVVFEDPGGWLTEDESGPTNIVARSLAAVGLYPSGGHLVKRVIGVAGDTIVCCDARGRISVNGEALDEDSFITYDRKTAACDGPMTGTCDWTAGPVPAGHVFVMGDHRDKSADSTVHMCTDDETDCVPGREFVDTDLVVGKVIALLWPASRFERLSRPDAFADVPDPK